ncbi:nucleotide exchange factor GrpE [Thermosulfurimonas dismutans]|uniref:Protein GrpE n=1 Tax=Thermosulfurimonas dismutans TaxID=999894 RepID=A0A179D5V9_9BACT|nr:nucleotide exchange factor GrpE [Thermosulfurimonas dismutans]OAQ21490.1 Heat shock protein GrpE [Thermosulfurimonas dismutans]
MVEVRELSEEKEPEKSQENLEAQEGERAKEEPKRVTITEEEYQQLKEECKLWQERALRYAAEVENLKKSFKREKEEFSKYALEQLFKELLPSIDNLERALEAAEKSQDPKGLIEGVALTLKGLLNAMEKFGLSQFETALGEPFNPHHHEALHVEETEEHPEGTVVRVYQKGYRLHDRIIRPALVAVAKNKKQDEGKE